MAVWAAVVAMAQLRRGQTAVVEELQRDDGSAGNLSGRLRELGFLDGEQVQVLATGAAGGPLAVRVGETTFALRIEEAARVRVRRRPF